MQINMAEIILKDNNIQNRNKKKNGTDTKKKLTKKYLNQAWLQEEIRKS